MAGVAGHRQMDPTAHAEVLLATLAQSERALEGALEAGPAGQGLAGGRQWSRSLANGGEHARPARPDEGDAERLRLRHSLGTRAVSLTAARFNRRMRKTPHVRWCGRVGGCNPRQPTRSSWTRLAPGETVPTLFPAQTPRMAGPRAIHPRRSFLRYRPPAPPDAHAYGLPLCCGAAQMNH